MDKTVGVKTNLESLGSNFYFVFLFDRVSPWFGQYGLLRTFSIKRCSDTIFPIPIPILVPSTQSISVCFYTYLINGFIHVVFNVLLNNVNVGLGDVPLYHHILRFFAD